MKPIVFFGTMHKMHYTYINPCMHSSAARRYTANRERLVVQSAQAYLMDRYCLSNQLKVCRELDGMYKLNVDFGPSLGMPVRKSLNSLSIGPKNPIQ